MTDTNGTSPFVQAERSALLMARSFAMMAINATDPNDPDDLEFMMGLGMEIQSLLMAHRAMFGRGSAPVAEA